MKDYHSIKYLSYQEVVEIFKYYLEPIWGNTIPMNFASLSWHSLSLKGLNFYSNKDEEIKARTHALSICVIYYEYCFRTAFSDSDKFNQWDGKIIENYLNDYIYDRRNSERSINQVFEVLIEILDINGLNNEMWINCQEAYQSYVSSIPIKIEQYNQLIIDGGYNHERGEDFIRETSKNGFKFDHFVSNLNIY